MVAGMNVAIESDVVTIDGAKRRQMLAQAVQQQVVQGARVESQSEYSAVTVKGKSVNHVLHLILSGVTFGFWIPVWIVLAIIGGEKRTMLNVDEFGNVAVQKV